MGRNSHRRESVSHHVSCGASSKVSATEVSRGQIPQPWRNAPFRVEACSTYTVKYTSERRLELRTVGSSDHRQLRVFVVLSSCPLTVLPTDSLFPTSRPPKLTRWQPRDCTVLAQDIEPPYRSYPRFQRGLKVQVQHLDLLSVLGSHHQLSYLGFPYLFLLALDRLRAQAHSTLVAIARYEDRFSCRKQMVGENIVLSS